VALVTVACRKDTPEPPIVTPGPPENVTGSERLGWTQRAADSAELSTFRYASYVDGARAELIGVSCQPAAAPTSSDFDCSAPLPAMSTGFHTIELAAFIADGDLLESARSAPLQLNRTTAAAAAPAPGPATWTSGMTVGTADGLQLQVDRIADGLVRPTDLAFLPDGRVLVAEEPGRVRVLMPDGSLLATPALSLGRGASVETQLLALGLDPRFGETHFVYAVFTTASGAGRAFTLARFRESSNALVDAVVLRDDIPASPRSAASLRGGPDGTLFVAFDDGGDPGNAGDFASPNGKILRLNPDGTTPRDQAGFNPMYAPDVHSPRGFDWGPGSTLLWIADRDGESPATLTAIGSAGVRLASYAFPRGTVPSSVAFYRGDAMPPFRDDLLVASDEGRHLLRVRLDPNDRTKVLGTERLLQNAIGGIRVVGVNREGAIYAATADALARLTAAPP
jgi:glucose/arabinose dehydrogenase